MISSVFTVTIAALRGRQNPNISNIIPQEAPQAFVIAGQLFGDVMQFGPSLQMMKGILAEIIPDMSGRVSP